MRLTPKLVWIESPTNPTLRLIDVYTRHRRPSAFTSITRSCHSFTPPLFSWGADLVLFTP
ncbi:hypothetical protein CPB85DRAFT_1336671 [Mucidula mucida]|nr:hypothetical protein CPB85DRAFT_1336671 [Mucidula mucida]